MSRDYKYRVNQGKKKQQQVSVAWWKWLFVFVLLAMFVLFLLFLNHSGSDNNESQISGKTLDSGESIQSSSSAKQQSAEPEEPHFEFYTILPETEVVVPDYEIRTRSREEQFGKGKVTQYIMQVGAFRDFSDADRLKARLALLGVESRVEKATIGSAVWNRVKIGPFSRSSNVSALKIKLRDNNIDVIVTEMKK